MYYITTCMSPCVNNVWTLLCEHPSVNCFIKGILPCMCMHNASLSTSTCNILPLAYHHVSSSVNNVWTLLCEHAFTNCFFKCTVPFMSMHNASLSTYTCTTLPLAFHNVCHHVWTMFEHYCVNIHLWIVSLNAIVPCMCMYKASLSTSTSTTLPLAYHHMLPSLNIVWRLMCQHASVNIFFKHIIPCMCMYMYCTVTRILTCVSICYHVAKCVNVLTCMYVHVDNDSVCYH